jgi:hypothetical protein
LKHEPEAFFISGQTCPACRPAKTKLSNLEFYRYHELHVENGGGEFLKELDEKWGIKIKGVPWLIIMVANKKPIVIDVSQTQPKIKEQLIKAGYNC